MFEREKLPPRFQKLTDEHPAFAALISSFRLAIRAPGGAKSTLRTYTDAPTKFAWWLVDKGIAADWAAVDKKTIQQYLIWFREVAKKCGCGKRSAHDDEGCPKGKPYEAGYINNQYRAIQQFFKWYAEEEEILSPTLGMRPPKLDDKVVPVIETADLARLIHECEKGKDFTSRRDAAILRLYACTGGRLAEFALIELEQISLDSLEALVMGKGRKQRIVKFDPKCARALDRYLRVRATHKYAQSPRLWLGFRGPMTESGIYQAIERRGEKVGLDINPHQFRHTFNHRWLDAGGAEGDLMELMGWESPQMLRRYGRSARSARARRAYDRINVMGDI